MELGFVVASEPDACQRVADEHCLDAFVEGRGTAQRGQHVNF